MPLGVAAPVHVEDEPAGPLGDAAAVGEGEAEVRLADPGRPVDDGERAREQAAAEHRVELRDSCQDAVFDHGRIVSRRFRVARPGGPGRLADSIDTPNPKVL